MQDLVVGIDIGGTNTVIGFVVESGECLEQRTLSTASFESITGFVQALHNQIRSGLAVLKNDYRLRSIGIGAPNGNYFSGCIEHAPNLRWKGIVDLAAQLKELMQTPVVLTNDANAAALGEKLYGAAKDIQNFILITIGTGLGSGLIVRGQLLYGHNGFAGEIGHTIAIPDGRPCSCGRNGCLEAYVSARGFVQTTVEIMESSKEGSALRTLPSNELTPETIDKAACNGDPIALAAFEATGELLGRQLADSVAYTAPEAIFLFGGLARAEGRLLEPTRRHLHRNLIAVYKGKVQLRLSGLIGQNAAILGAAALAWNELEREPKKHEPTPLVQQPS
jgi:glucokinase